MPLHTSHLVLATHLQLAIHDRSMAPWLDRTNVALQLRRRVRRSIAPSPILRRSHGVIMNGEHKT